MIFSSKKSWLLLACKRILKCISVVTSLMRKTQGCLAHHLQFDPPAEFDGVEL